jgi:hypothetical protein
MRYSQHTVAINTHQSTQIQLCTNNSNKCMSIYNDVMATVFLLSTLTMSTVSIYDELDNFDKASKMVCFLL